MADPTREAERMTEWDHNELQKAWDDMLDNYNDVKRIVQRHVDRSKFERLKAYGFNYVEAGLGVGDALPSFNPINVIVEQLLELPNGGDDDDSDDDA